MSQTKKNDTGKGDATNSASTKILAKIEEIQQQVKEDNANTSLILAEVMKKLDELSLKVTSGGTSSRANRGTKTSTSTTSGPSNKKKFPLNSLAWFKEEYKTNRDETCKMFFDDEQMSELEEFMKTDPKEKDKEDEAKQNGEISHLWNTYVSKDAARRKKIKDEYEERKKSFDAANKTPAGKEREGDDEAS
jgi:hypothetical protein